MPKPQVGKLPQQLWKRIWGSPNQQGQQADGTREIIETVVFVVVLVLLLKTFAAEAFVIPTGSMAETLWGYQKVVTCTECKYKFPVNCSQEVDPTDGERMPVLSCTCPNCRKHLTLKPGDPSWSSGDRVLVSKYVYDLIQNPQRLDVVVFKFPGDSDGPRGRNRFPHSGPIKGHVPLNYIKRLIGLPGETIAIQTGDLFILPPEKSPQYKVDEEAREQRTLWRTPHMFKEDPDQRASNLFKKGEFGILRKPPAKMLALRRIVHDNQHQAKDLKEIKHPSRWKGLDAWEADGDHAFRHPEGSGESISWLRYRHLLRDHNNPSLITDFMGYNTGGPGGSSGHNWVKDLMLECEAKVESNQGLLILELSRGVDRFQARFDIAEGTCALVRLGEEGKETELGKKLTSLKGKGTYDLRFASFDQRLTLWVDGRLPFDDGVTFDAPKRIEPTEENDRDRPVSIGVRGASIRIDALTLWRDTYYTQDPGKADVPGFDASDPSTYGEIRDIEPLTLYVQPGHYLCLGDNSPQSSDGRSWGAVPRRLLLGRAVLVYWPLSRLGRIR